MSVVQKNSNEVCASTDKNSRRVRGNGDGTIYKDKKRNKWNASFYDYKRIRRTASFTKKADAESWIVEQKEAKERGEGTYAARPKQSVAEFLDEWVERRKPPRVRPNTYRYYKETIKHRINPYIGDQKASRLKPIIIEEELLDILVAKGFKAGTVNGVIRTLNKAFSDGKRLGLILNNPIDKIEKPTLESTSSRAVLQEDLKKMYSVAALNPYDLAKIVIAAEIGARPGEIRGLKWSDVDNEKLTINIERQVIRVKAEGLSFAPPKTKRTGATPITARQLRILLDHKRYQSLNKSMWVTDLDLIFPNSIGNMLDESRDKRWMKNICEKALVPRYSLYQFRKTAFTELLISSDIGTTMAFSGHSQASTLFDHYISPEEAAVRRAIEARETANPALQAEVIDINRSA